MTILKSIVTLIAFLYGFLNFCKAEYKLKLELAHTLYERTTYGPPKVYAPTCAYQLKKIWCVAARGGKNLTFFMFDTMESPVIIGEIAPVSRMFPTLTAIGDNSLFLHGGMGMDGTMLNDAWLATINKKGKDMRSIATWEYMGTTRDFAPYGHLAAQYQDKWIFFFGGDTAGSDIHKVHLKTTRFVCIKAVGDKPYARVYGNMDIVNDTIYTFGGFPVEQGQQVEMYKFHIPSLTWHKVPTSSATPQLNNAMSVVRDNFIFYTFGDFANKKPLIYAFDTTTDEWLEPFTVKGLPYRSSHVVILNSMKNLFIYGGTDISQHMTNYAYCVTVGKRKIKKKKKNKEKKKKEEEKVEEVHAEMVPDAATVKAGVAVYCKRITADYREKHPKKLRGKAKVQFSEAEEDAKDIASSSKNFLLSPKIDLPDIVHDQNASLTSKNEVNNRSNDETGRNPVAHASQVNSSRIAISSSENSSSLLCALGSMVLTETII